MFLSQYVQYTDFTPSNTIPSINLNSILQLFFYVAVDGARQRAQNLSASIFMKMRLEWTGNTGSTMCNSLEFSELCFYGWHPSSYQQLGHAPAWQQPYCENLRQNNDLPLRAPQPFRNLQQPAPKCATQQPPFTKTLPHFSSTVHSHKRTLHHPPLTQAHPASPQISPPSVQSYSLLLKPIPQHQNVLTSCFFRHQDAHCVHGECYTMLRCWRVILNDRLGSVVSGASPLQEHMIQHSWTAVSNQLEHAKLCEQSYLRRKTDSELREHPIVQSIS